MLTHLLTTTHKFPSLDAAVEAAEAEADGPLGLAAQPVVDDGAGDQQVDGHQPFQSRDNLDKWKNLMKRFSSFN